MGLLLASRSLLISPGDAKSLVLFEGEAGPRALRARLGDPIELWLGLFSVSSGMSVSDWDGANTVTGRPASPKVLTEPREELALISALARPAATPDSTGETAVFSVVIISMMVVEGLTSCCTDSSLEMLAATCEYGVRGLFMADNEPTGGTGDWTWCSDVC